MNTINDKVAITSYAPSTANAVKKEQESSIVTREKTPEIKPDTEQNTPVIKRVESKGSETDLDNLVSIINAKLAAANDFISFTKDEMSGRNVYSLVDSESKDIIKQFPSEDFLKVSRKIQQYLESNSKEQGLSESIGNLVDSSA